MRAAPEISFRKQSPLAAHFSDTEWVAKLAYLCDIFNLLNELNLSLQRRTITVFKSADKVAAFKTKLELWGRWVNVGIFDMFQTFAEILKETEPGPSFSQLVNDHLSQLSKEFEGTPLVVQWLGICLPMQGTRVRSLVQEDPTCRRAAKPVHHNYWACVPEVLKPGHLEPVLHNKRSHLYEKPAHHNEE